MLKKILILLHKKGNKTEVYKCRSKALSSVLSKIRENLIKRRKLHFFDLLVNSELQQKKNTNDTKNFET